MNHATYTDKGLVISDEITESELKKEIKTIFANKESLPFVMGDLLVFLSRRHNVALDLKAQKKPYNREHIGIYKTLLDADKSNKSYLVTCKKTCLFFPFEKRTFPVAFSTYKEAVVLAKEPAAAIELVKEAAENKWSYRELRKTFRERQALASGQVNREKPNAVAEIIKLANELKRKLGGTFNEKEADFICRALLPVSSWVNDHQLESHNK